MVHPFNRRRVGDTAEMFNDMGYLAGLSPDYHFVDITSTIAAGTKTPAVLQTYLAVTVALTPGPGPNGPRAALTNMSRIVDTPVLWIPHTVRHIPDVYALLHAVLNCPHPVSIDSIFGQLGRSMANVSARDRLTIMEQAGGLQKAFVKAVGNGAWGKKPTKPVTEQLASGPCQYYTFVLHAKTGKVFLLDVDGAQPVDSIDMNEKWDGGTPSVLTGKVLGMLGSVVVREAGNGGEVAIVGLVRQEC